MPGYVLVGSSSSTADGIPRALPLPRCCRHRTHEPTLVPQLPQPALGLLWTTLTTASSPTASPSAFCHSRAVGSIMYRFTRGSSENVSRLFPRRTSYSVLCPIAAAKGQGKNSASLQRNRGAALSTDGLERRRCILAEKPETEERLACSAWDGCRTAGEGSGARTGWARRGSPSKPITCKIVLPFWKSESWARQGQLVAMQVYSLPLMLAVACFLHASAMIEGTRQNCERHRSIHACSLPVRKKYLHDEPRESRTGEASNNTFRCCCSAARRLSQTRGVFRRAAGHVSTLDRFACASFVLGIVKSSSPCSRTLDSVGRHKGELSLILPMIDLCASEAPSGSQ
jgi:hypothetical protein